LKIVDVTEFYSERGGGIRSHLTVRGHFLCQLGHEHVVMAPGPRDEDAPSQQPVAAGPIPSRLVRFAGPIQPYDRTYHLLGRLDKVRQRIRAERADVLEAHSPYLAAAAIVASGRSACRARTAFWHSDHVGTYVQPALERWLGRAGAQAGTAPLWQALRALLLPFDAVFAAGRAQANRLVKAGVKNVVYVPFGVDTATFRPSARSDEERRRWLGDASDGATLFVGLGRFAVDKRWDVVLDAFARVRAHREAVLVLFGDGPERERLEARAPHGVRFAGFEQDRAKLARALASADILVHGSPYETFGLSVAEAVASGLPIVVPCSGGAAESADPSSSESYPDLNVAACASAIERLLRRDRSELRARALEAACRVPSMHQHFTQILAAYEDLLRGRTVQS
jgi:alpha-1,6-mannosyltransferase